MNTNIIPLDENEELTQLCDENGLDDEAFITYCKNFHVTEDFADHVADFTDSYQGYYYDFTDFARQLMDDTMEIPDHLVGYIDYEAFARDLSRSGDYWEDRGYVFRGI